jgi:2-deoxy-D-gluconate 3-dehydrogenase
MPRLAGNVCSMNTPTALTQPPLAELVDLSGKTAIVTGGAMGIGCGIVERLHQAGAAVVIADLDLDTGASVAERLNAGRANSALAMQTDVSRRADVDAMVAACVESFGGVDILVNNAGIYPMLPMSDLDVETFRRVIDVNLTGLFICTKAASARMIAQGRGGRIVNVTSIDALHPSMVGLAHYDASKHGAWGFTKNIALELAPHNIAVNAIAPGGIRTPGTGDMDEAALAGFEAMIPMRRMGDPDDIGRAALFLACELSSYMTGAQIVVDGGRLLA